MSNFGPGSGAGSKRSASREGGRGVKRGGDGPANRSASKGNSRSVSRNRDTEMDWSSTTAADQDWTGEQPQRGKAPASDPVLEKEALEL